MHLTRLAGVPRRARTGSSRLRIEALEDRAVPAVIAEVEPTDTFGTAQAVPIATGDVTTTAPADWLTIVGSVGTGADNDYYAFTLTAAAGVFFDVDARDTGLSATLDSVLTLFNSGGTAVSGAANDDGYDFEGFAVPNASSGSATSDAACPSKSRYRVSAAPGLLANDGGLEEYVESASIRRL